MKQFFLFCSAIALSTPALAAPFTYGPDNCEFQITFPEKPFIEKKCGQNVADCAEVVTFTKAVGAASSTHFRVTCNPLEPKDIEKYTPEIIAETLNQLVKSNNLIPYTSQSADENGYKSATTVSLAERDGKTVIYNGQIWIGKKSMFTIEAEMLGPKSDEVEKTFVDIMRNTYPKDRPPTPPAPKVDAEKTKQ